MSESKRCVLISVLISLFTISLFTALSVIPAVFPQENENVFSVSPGSFTAKNVPPLGTPYIIPQNIVVWNRDNVDRVVVITSEVPPAGHVSPGYEPIPNDNWVVPFPSSVVIKENSYAVIELSFNIPRWENLTGENWDVRIHAERQPIIVDNALEPIVLGLDVVVRIQTTKELPPPPGKVNLALLAVVGIVIAVAVICIGVWLYSRKTGGGGKPRKVRSLRSQG
jgi:hypothetical protein